MSRFLRFPAIPSPSHTMSLDAVIRRLAGRPVVEGVFLTGSTAGNEVTGESDYDLTRSWSMRPANDTGTCNLKLAYLPHRC